MDIPETTTKKLPNHNISYTTWKNPKGILKIDDFSEVDPGTRIWLAGTKQNKEWYFVRDEGDSILVQTNWGRRRHVFKGEVILHPDVGEEILWERKSFEEKIWDMSTKKDLKKIAKKNDIRRYSHLKKIDLINKLEEKLGKEVLEERFLSNI